MVNVIDVDLEPCLSEAKSLASFVWAVADRRGRKPNTYDENEYKAAWIACVHIAQREYFRTRDCCIGKRQTTTEIVVAPEIGTVDR
ncbi:hypothetical protein DAPPUDRAFT_269972 [Daphnia pulex]|uniref:Uncharacterized protein n=1 Tax=Daphnia pulex TaxID=6669 RepID=E9I011_DAPPU|nr:hypothetical protein DAPPUDRAFT_269972 [Daphnia pulex]|eukprot:EFX62669.1 hypothetical protein DAPPUDRAFT_269972 [Daphnia pulex]